MALGFFLMRSQMLRIKLYHYRLLCFPFPRCIVNVKVK